MKITNYRIRKDKMKIMKIFLFMLSSEDYKKKKQIESKEELLF